MKAGRGPCRAGVRLERAPPPRSPPHHHLAPTFPPGSLPQPTWIRASPHPCLPPLLPLHAAFMLPSPLPFPAPANMDQSFPCFRAPPPPGGRGPGGRRHLHPGVAASAGPATVGNLAPSMAAAGGGAPPAPLVVYSSEVRLWRACVPSWCLAGGRRRRASHRRAPLALQPRFPISLPSAPLPLVAEHPAA